MFTQSERDEIQSLRAIPFDSFKEPVFVYKTAQTTYVSTSPNYNFAFQENQPDANVSFTPESGTFLATVQHSSFFPDFKERAASPAPLVISNPYVKIGVTGDAKDFFLGAEKIVVDGIEFKPVSKERPRGILVRNYYEFYFERID